MLGPARAVAQRGFALVARFRVDAVQRDHGPKLQPVSSLAKGTLRLQGPRLLSRRSPKRSPGHEHPSPRNHRSRRYPRLLRGHRRRARPSQGLSRKGRRELRRMPLLRPPLRPEGRGAPALSKPAAPLKKGDHLYLIDGSGYIFRAYHALPPLTRKSDGLPVGAVSGYCNMMWKLLEDMKGADAPTHLAVVFDAGAVTFPNAMYE